MKVAHGVQSLAEAARRYGNFDEVRKILLDSFRALSAFVAAYHRALETPLMPSLLRLRAFARL